MCSLLQTVRPIDLFGTCVATGLAASHHPHTRNPTTMVLLCRVAMIPLAPKPQGHILSHSFLPMTPAVPVCLSQSSHPGLPDILHK